MPLTGGNVQNDAAWAHIDGLDQNTILVVEILLKMAADANNSLGRCVMSMDGHHGSGLNGIEHPLRLVFRGIAEVEVHP